MIFRVVSLILTLSAPAFADGAYLLLAVPMGFIITPILGWFLAGFLRAATRRLASRAFTLLVCSVAFFLSLRFFLDYVAEPQYGPTWMLAIYTAVAAAGGLPPMILLRLGLAGTGVEDPPFDKLECR